LRDKLTLLLIILHIVTVGLAVIEERYHQEVLDSRLNTDSQRRCCFSSANGNISLLYWSITASYVRRKLLLCMCRMHDVSIRLCFWLGPRLLPASATGLLFLSSTSGTRGVARRCDMLCFINFFVGAPPPAVLPACPTPHKLVPAPQHRDGDGECNAMLPGYR
jgi:hypothetical protein